MADSPEKRLREAKKRKKRDIKAKRKMLRKQGLLGQDDTGLFPPGERPRGTAPVSKSPQPYEGLEEPVP